MKRRLAQTIRLTMLVLTIALLSGAPLAAQTSNPTRGGSNPSSRVPVRLPDHAFEVAPGLYYLGATMVQGKRIEGYAFVRYDKAYAKPGGGSTGTVSCYTYLSKGARWKTVEPYVVDPINRRGLDPAYVQQNLAADIAKWEDAANGKVGDGVSSDILGAEVPGTVYPTQIGTLNGQNEVFFGDIAQSGAIAITYIWGFFGGAPAMRQLVEWDQVYDDGDFDWGIGVAGKMDFENIATHELGHSVGMGDLYDTKCSAMTMYGYASNGETSKRDLADGDIAGINALY